MIRLASLLLALSLLTWPATAYAECAWLNVAGGFRCRSPRRTPTRGRGPSSPRRLGSGSSRRSLNGSVHDGGVRT
jgi:hypothetical protein